MDEDDAIPAPVRLVRDFVNTYEPQVDEESLTAPETLRTWLADRDLISADADVTAHDVTTARVVREGLRSVLLDHAGHEPDPTALDALNAVLADTPVAVRFDGGGYRLGPVGGSPLAVALAGVLDAVRQAAEDQSWARLKVCARDTCRWAFYDASRNQARRWCSMAGCGNAVKMRRAYAARVGRRSAEGLRPARER